MPIELAKSYAGDKVINMMSIGASQQVMLEVRFSEINRQTGKQIGFSGFTGSNDGGTFGSATGNGASLVPDPDTGEGILKPGFDHQQLWRVPQSVRRIGPEHQRDIGRAGAQGAGQDAGRADIGRPVG